MAVDAGFAASRFTLSNGVEMPAIGMGTYRIRDKDVLYRTVDCALAVGYRLFGRYETLAFGQPKSGVSCANFVCGSNGALFADTAAVYQNEQHLGTALRHLLPKYGLTRKDIFITTKLSPSDLGADRTTRALEVSLQNLGLEYIDLYLIHFPGAARIPAHSPKNTELRTETWNTMVKLYEQGKVRAIGVSNFTTTHLSQLAQSSTTTPTVNQVEWHPHYYQSELLQYCRSHDIRLQAYCSFGGLAVSNKSLMEEPVVVDVSKKYGATPAQVLLGWALQRGVGVIPKSTTPHRIRENIELNFRMSSDDLAAIDNLGDKHCKYAWDPNPIA